MDRHELTRIQRTKDRAGLERAMLDAMIGQATNLPAMRIGDRDPDTGKDAVIFPDGGQAIAGLRLFNASVSPDQIIKSTQPSDSPIIRLDYKSHKETAQTTSTQVLKLVKILFSLDGLNWSIGGFQQTPIAIPIVLELDESLTMIGAQNLGGSDYIAYAIAAKSVPPSSAKFRILNISSISALNWIYEITIPSPDSVFVSAIAYGLWTFRVGAATYSLLGGEIQASDPGLLYYPFPGTGIASPQTYMTNQSYTRAIGVVSAEVWRMVSPSNLEGLSIPAVSLLPGQSPQSVQGVTFIDDALYLTRPFLYYISGDNITVQKQQMGSATVETFQESYYPIPDGVIVRDVSYYPE